MTQPEPSPTRDADLAMKRLLDRPVDATDLREHATRVASPLEDETQETMSLLVMQVGAEWLALPARDVTRVDAVVPVHRVPHRTNDVVRGLCNIDGALVLTAALDRLLQIDGDAGEGPESDPGSRRMVVIGTVSEPWAFAVDAVAGVDRFDVATFRGLPVTVEHALGHFAEALVPIEDGHATILDATRLLAGLQGALT